MDLVDPQPTLVERLVRHGLLPRELLPQIGINSKKDGRGGQTTLEGLLRFDREAERFLYPPVFVFSFGVRIEEREWIGDDRDALHLDM